MPMRLPRSASRRPSTAGEDFVFCFHKAAGVLLSSYVPQFLVSSERRKERDTLSDQYRYSCDREVLNETGTQETLDRDSTVDGFRSKRWRVASMRPPSSASSLAMDGLPL